MTFRVGQKVVCVDAAPLGKGTVFLNSYGRLIRSDGDMGGLRKGGIYTIAHIHSAAHVTAFMLSEINRGPKDTGFRASRFRPIVERKTDISIFTAMLNPSKQGVEA